MKREKQELIDDLLGDRERREATLSAGARALRQRRHLRAASKGGLLALPLMMILLALHFRNPSPGPVQPVATAVEPAVNIEVRALSDSELLALFPDTPVALATLSNGKKKLLFLRPGDEERFIRRL